jgi:hypothetical protein
MSLVLKRWDGLYYAPTDVCTVDRSPVHPITPRVCCVLHPPTTSLHHPSPRYVPVSKSNQTESELWMLCLGSPGKYQLDMPPGNVTGTPSVFEYHPFRFVNFKEQARIRKQSAHRSAERTTGTRKRFYMDFDFMRSSQSGYSCPNKRTDCHGMDILPIS